MAKFTKLNIGDAVASSGGRVWKKLSAESEVDYSTIVGTWKFATTANFNGLSDAKCATIDVSSGDIMGTWMCSRKTFTIYKGILSCSSIYAGKSGYMGIMFVNNSLYLSSSSERLYLDDLGNSELTITDDVGMVFTDNFKTWLNANATKIA